VQGLGDQRQRADRDADGEFAAAMPALAKIEIAATLVLREGGCFMGGGLAGVV
jgi:hypothetical protein